MSNEQKRPLDGEKTDHWDRLSSELRAYKESQRRTWGDLDDVTLGRYLAGEVTGAEANLIEDELRQRPELRMLTDLVREVLGDANPIEEPKPILRIADAPRFVRSMPKEKTRRRSVLSFVQRRSSLVAAACLLIVLGVAMPRPNGESTFSEDPGESPEIALAARGALQPIGADAPMAMRMNQADNHPAVAMALPIDNREVRGSERPQVRSNAFETKRSNSFAASATTMRSRPDKKGRKGTPSRDKMEWVVSLQREGNELREKGDLVAAEKKLAQSYYFCKNRFGVEHQATRSSARYLADVYVNWLTTKQGSGASVQDDKQALTTQSTETQILAANSQGGKTSTKSAPEEGVRYLTATQLDHLPVSEVKRQVVPVLALAIQCAPTCEKRVQYLQAIGQLGPVARGAVPALVQRLEEAHEPAEVEEILNTLKHVGPAARAALTSLENVKSVGTQQKKVQILRLAHDLKNQAQVVGVRDEAGCFTFGVVRKSCSKLRQLARTAGVQVLVETTAQPRAHPGKVLESMGARAIYVSIHPQGNSVEVKLSAQLKKEGMDAEKLRQRFLASLREGKFDQVLLDSVQTIQAKLDPAKP